MILHDIQLCIIGIIIQDGIQNDPRKAQIQAALADTLDTILCISSISISIRSIIMMMLSSLISNVIIDQ